MSDILKTEIEVDVKYFEAYLSLNEFNKKTFHSMIIDNLINDLHKSYKEYKEKQ